MVPIDFEKRKVGASVVSDSPLVSIITPSFNQGQFIEETIRSVLLQGYPNLEYIIMDAGSTDGTLDILRRYSDQITWVSEPDRGQSDGFNKGLQRANGDIIGWLNSDDLLEPGAIVKTARHFQTHPESHVAYGDCNIIDEQGQIRENKKGSYTRQKLVEFWREWYHGLYYSSTFYRREVFDKVGGLDVNLHMAMDYDFLLRVGEFFEFEYIPATLSRFRVHNQSKSSQGIAKFMVELQPVVKRYWRGRSWWRYIQYSVIMRMIYGRMAFHAFASSVPFEGEDRRLRTLLRALQLNPALLISQPMLKRFFRLVKNPSLLKNNL